MHFVLVIIAGLGLACSPGVVDSQDEKPIEARVPSALTVEAVPSPTLTIAGSDKWMLWTGGTHLRGANIYRRRVYPELDSPEFMGPGAVGPPYTQDDFDWLADLGANYVNLSHPGPFTEEPPYLPDPKLATWKQGYPYSIANMRWPTPQRLMPMPMLRDSCPTSVAGRFRS